MLHHLSNENDLKFEEDRIRIRKNQKTDFMLIS